MRNLHWDQDTPLNKIETIIATIPFYPALDLQQQYKFRQALETGYKRIIERFSKLLEQEKNNSISKSGKKTLKKYQNAVRDYAPKIRSYQSNRNMKYFKDNGWKGNPIPAETIFDEQFKGEMLVSVSQETDNVTYQLQSTDPAQGFIIDQIFDKNVNLKSYEADYDHKAETLLNQQLKQIKNLPKAIKNDYFASIMRLNGTASLQNADQIYSDIKSGYERFNRDYTAKIQTLKDTVANMRRIDANYQPPQDLTHLETIVANYAKTFRDFDIHYRYYKDHVGLLAEIDAKLMSELSSNCLETFFPELIQYHTNDIIRAGILTLESGEPEYVRDFKY